VLGLPLSSQSFAAQVTASADVAVGGLAFEIPTLHHLKGTVHPAAGNRLHIVSIALGEEGMETEVRRLALVTTSGSRYEAIGAGGGALMIIPFDRVPIDREIGQVLPSDAIVSLTRSATTLILEASPHATLAFLFEVPATASVRGLRMPDGRELATTR
jgi:hypothetical protein